MVSKTKVQIKKKNLDDTQFQVLNGTYYHSKTPEELIVLLEKYRTREDTVRLHYGDTVTGRDWLEEHDVRGKIGRSTGSCKVPLLIEPGERGGLQLLDHCIVRLLYCMNGVDKEVYRHPTYNIPAVALIPVDELGYTVAAKVNGHIHARFRTLVEAGLYLVEMGFERISDDK